MNAIPDLLEALRALARWHGHEAERHDEAGDSVDPTAPQADQHEADMHYEAGETHRIAAILIRDAIADPVALIKALADQPDSDPPIPNSATSGA